MAIRPGITTVVLIKQVPSAGALEFDAETGRIVRDGVPNEINTYDLRALEAAFATRERVGGEVVVMTMGPPDAKEALNICLALGADRGVLLSDRAFAGSDTLATARTLHLAVRRYLPDLILAGRASTDAETGNVGPQLAELLAYPQLTSVTNFRVDDIGRSVKATRQTELSMEEVHVKLPAVVSVLEDVADEPDVNNLTIPSDADERIDVLDAKTLDVDVNTIGVKGSPTEVSGSQPGPEAMRRPKIIEFDGPIDAETVEKLNEWLNTTEESQQEVTVGSHPVPESIRTSEKSVLVVSETSPKGLSPATLELLSGANRLADELKARVDVLVVGETTESVINELGEHGADQIVINDDEEIIDYDTIQYSQAVVELAEETHPEVLLMSSSVQGRDLAPRVAARLETGLTADATGFTVSGNKITWDKPAFGGGLIAAISSLFSPSMATLRPGVLIAPLPVTGRRAEVKTQKRFPLARPMVTTEKTTPITDGGFLQSANKVICVGMGATSFLDEVIAFAKRIGAELGYTRKAVDNGFGHRSRQIGLSGITVSPETYIAVGISGAYEHAVGMNRAKKVLCIDVDEDCFMFEYADLAVIGDGRDVISSLALDHADLSLATD